MVLISSKAVLESLIGFEREEMNGEKKENGPVSRGGRAKGNGFG
jgi:hypothetical protein